MTESAMLACAAVRSGRLRPVNVVFAAAAMALACLAGCQPPKQLQTSVVRPSALNIAGVRTLAVGGFTVESLEAMAMTAPQTGEWQFSPLSTAAQEALAADIKSDLVSALYETPHYRVVDVEAFNTIHDVKGLAGLVGATSLTPGEIQAVVFGRAWVGYYELSGAESRKELLGEWVQNQDGAWRKVRDHEELVQYPYRKVSGVLVVQYSMVRLFPRLEVISVQTVAKNFRQKEGGGADLRTPKDLATGLLALFGGGKRSVGTSKTKAETGGILPLPAEVFSGLSKEVARDFVGRISPRQENWILPTALNGDAVARNLILGMAYDSAVERLRDIIAGRVAGTVAHPEGQEATWAPELYNLGLAYEAKGPAYYEDALHNYWEAVQRDPANPLYADGLGRIQMLLGEEGLLELQKQDLEKKAGP